MNSNRIAERITDLLRLAGFTEEHTIDELKDHYLTHIEEEVKRGVNAQQAVRESFQDIANIDISAFRNTSKHTKLRNIFLLTLGILAFVLSFLNINQDNLQPTHSEPIAHQTEQNTNSPKIDPPTGLPIDQSNLDITANYGWRMHPVSQRKQLHKGIDIRAKKGTPVLATGDGEVLEAGYKRKTGKYIVIQHAGNYITKYYHLSDFSVIAGVAVTKGQAIGKVGNSGMSFMPHLHYEILQNEVPLNPKKYIKP